LLDKKFNNTRAIVLPCALSAETIVSTPGEVKIFLRGMRLSLPDMPDFFLGFIGESSGPVKDSLVADQRKYRGNLWLFSRLTTMTTDGWTRRFGEFAGCDGLG
jgi:hypothetical protein